MNKSEELNLDKYSALEGENKSNEEKIEELNNIIKKLELTVNTNFRDISNLQVVVCLIYNNFKIVILTKYIILLNTRAQNLIWKIKSLKFMN